MIAVSTELAWLVGRYAFLGLLYLFVLLVLRALVAELHEGVGVPRPVRYEPAPGPAADPADTGRLGQPVAPEPPPEAPAQVSPAAQALPPRLVVVESADPTELPTGTSFTLTAVTTVGRGAHNSIALPADKFASTNHSLVFVRDGAMYLRDRGSTNGTLVNGERVDGEVLLRDGDRITVGTTVLRYGAGATPAQADAPLAADT